MCVYENVPVSMSARAGIVGNEEITCWSKTTEDRANSSKCGVLMIGLPYVPMSSLRNVSATITTTLGRAWSCMNPPALGSLGPDRRLRRLLKQDWRSAPSGKVLCAFQTPFVAESPVRPPEHPTPATKRVRSGGPTNQEQQKPNKLAPAYLRPPLQQAERVAIPRTKLANGRPPRCRCYRIVYVANCAPVAHCSTSSIKVQLCQWAFRCRTRRPGEARWVALFQTRKAIATGGQESRRRRP